MTASKKSAHKSKRSVPEPVKLGYTPSERAWINAAAPKSRAHTKRSAESPAVGPGTVLGGNWLIEKKLGAGGMGSVWSAVNLGTGMRAAIKTMRPEDAASKHYRDLFFREGRIGNVVYDAARMPMPTGSGGVPVYDDGEAPDGTPYLVMEKLDGLPLSALVPERGDRASPAVVEVVMDELLQVLEPMHAQGIVHRDLKPDNIFITRTHDVRLLDMGLAQLPGDPPSPGHFVGTPSYAPPEQSIGIAADPRSDIYGLGATAYRLLSGQTVTPYSVEAGEEYLAHLPTGQFERVVSGRSRPNFKGYPSCPAKPLPDDVPEGLRHVVMKAVECDPARRYQSASEMRADLESAIQQELLQSARGSASSGSKSSGGERVRLRSEGGRRGPHSVDSHAPTART